MLSLDLKERCYAADVVYPMAVVTTAQKGIYLALFLSKSFIWLLIVLTIHSLIFNAVLHITVP